MSREHAITAEPRCSEAITATDLMRVKEFIETQAREADTSSARGLAAWLRNVAKAAESVGGIERLADCADAYAALVPGKG